MRLIIYIGLALLAIYVVYMALNPPKPQAVVISGGQQQQQGQSGNVVIQPVSPTAPISVSATCRFLYVKTPVLEACNVAQVSDSNIVLAAPGWIRGSFTVNYVYGTCQFRTNPSGVLEFYGQGCQISVTQTNINQPSVS